MTKRKNQRDDDDYDDYGYFYPPSRPIHVEGGIQSRNKRGTFAANWWAKRWIAVLESYGIGGRLQRGRTYARQGQVLDIQIKPGEVRSSVQGSQTKPYKVTLHITPFSDAEWERALDAISEQAIFTAQLLNGEMPQEIEDAFNAAKTPLFPQKARDVVTDCSCPDMSNPCKHIAAVYYLLGEQFDQDPFLIFTLRGRSREQVIEALRQRRADSTGSDGEAIIPAEPVPSLEDQINAFWGDPAWSPTPPSLTPPPTTGRTLRRLGDPPGDLKQPLQALYTALTAYVQTRLHPDDEQA